MNEDTGRHLAANEEGAHLGVIFTHSVGREVHTEALGDVNKQDQGSKAPSGHLPIGSSTYWSFIYLSYLTFYLTNLSFAPSTFIPYLPFYPVYLTNL